MTGAVEVSVWRNIRRNPGKVSSHLQLHPFVSPQLRSFSSLMFLYLLYPIEFSAGQCCLCAVLASLLLWRDETNAVHLRFDRSGGKRLKELDWEGGKDSAGNGNDGLPWFNRYGALQSITNKRGKKTKAEAKQLKHNKKASFGRVKLTQNTRIGSILKHLSLSATDGNIDFLFLFLFKGGVSPCQSPIPLLSGDLWHFLPAVLPCSAETYASLSKWLRSKRGSGKR